MAKKKKTKELFKYFAPPEGQAKILVFDIETAPIIAHVWGLWENNVGLNQIVADWHCLSWSAKWYLAPESEVMYMDQRHIKNVEDDKKMLEGIWRLLDEADIVVTQNGISFDKPKLYARFLLNGMNKPSTFKHIDTKVLMSRHFKLSSNKLEFATDKLCVKHKKLKHKKYPGHEMWTECLNGNQDAWNCMEEYNKHDVLALEELYDVLKKWDNTINFNLYTDEAVNVCKCGSKEFTKNGFYYTNVGKFQRWRCKNPKCGTELRDRANLFSKEKKESLKLGTN